MIVDGQCYIVIAPGMELLKEVPAGVQFYNHGTYRWELRDDDWGGLTDVDTYRYPVTEAVYKAHHWCIAHGVGVPDGYEVVGFYKYYGRDRMKGLFGLVPSGEVCTDVDLMHSYERPILRKKVCEHKDNVESYEDNKLVGQRCLSCGMTRKLGDWEKSE
jgi:hypothetical protein